MQRRGAEVVGGGHGSSKSKYPEGQDPEKSARKQDKRKMARRGSGFDSDGDAGYGGYGGDLGGHPRHELLPTAACRWPRIAIT